MWKTPTNWKKDLYMSETFDAMLTRRSVRSFKSDPVPQELVDKVIEAGLYAASGMNSQSSIVIQISDPETMDELRRVNAEILGAKPGFDPFYGAPMALIVLANVDVFTYVYDGTLTMGNMMLAAHDLGLASCWVHRAKEEFESEFGRKLLEKLGLDDEWEGIGHLALGYADGPLPEAKPRSEGRAFRI